MAEVMWRERAVRVSESESVCERERERRDGVGDKDTERVAGGQPSEGKESINEWLIPGRLPAS